MQFKNKVMNFVFGIRGIQVDAPSDSVGDLYKRLLIVAWPAALEGLFMTLMNALDTMMVGRLGSAAIASVGLCSQPRMILLLIAQSLCIGTTAIVARRKGAGDQESAVSTVKQSLAIITVVGILMVISGYFLAKPLLLLAGANEETLPAAQVYFQIISMAFVANCWTLCVCASMRGIGKTRITLSVNVVTNVVNVFLNYCLINGHFGFPALGVRGAAIATACGTCAGCVMAIIVILKKDNYLSIRRYGGLKNLRFDKQTLTSLVNIGSGSIAESVFMRVGFLINGRLIAGVSTAAYATNQVVMQVSSMSFTLGDGLGSSATAMVGQSLGAEQKSTAMAYVKIARRCALFLSLALMALMFFGRHFLPALFTDETEIIQMASLCFIIVLGGCYGQIIRVAYVGCLRGAGDVKYVAMISLLCVLILRPLITWFFCYPMRAWFPEIPFGFIGSWISFDIDAVVRGWLLIRRVNQGKWVNIKV